VLILALVAVGWAARQLFFSNSDAPPSSPSALPTVVDPPAPPSPPERRPAQPPRPRPPAPAAVAAPPHSSAAPTPRPPQEDEKNDMPEAKFREIQRRQGPTTHPVE
jgi:hypothetical protein